jgi:hypothetical protein
VRATSVLPGLCGVTSPNNPTEVAPLQPRLPSPAHLQQPRHRASRPRLQLPPLEPRRRRPPQRHPRHRPRPRPRPPPTPHPARRHATRARNRTQQPAIDTSTTDRRHHASHDHRQDSTTLAPQPRNSGRTTSAGSSLARRAPTTGTTLDATKPSPGWLPARSSTLLSSGRLWLLRTRPTPYHDPTLASPTEEDQPTTDRGDRHDPTGTADPAPNQAT